VGESIARIPEAWKHFLDPDSGNGVDVLTRRSKKILFSSGKHQSDSNFMRRIDCAHSRSMKNYLYPDSGNGFCGRAKKEDVSIFASIHQLHSLNQSQDNFFMLKKYAQSIPRIKCGEQCSERLCFLTFSYYCLLFNTNKIFSCLYVFVFANRDI
jgi:hypothetical protein